MNDEMFKGFNLLEEELNNIIKNVDTPTDILEVGAKDFVNDLLKLPKPISTIKKQGYTHLIDTFAYRIKNGEVEVGWGKYYGIMVENGTIKMNAVSHMKPLWNKNKDKYYKKMIDKIYN